MVCAAGCTVFRDPAWPCRGLAAREDGQGGRSGRTMACIPKVFLPAEKDLWEEPREALPHTDRSHGAVIPDVFQVGL